MSAHSDRTRYRKKVADREKKLASVDDWLRENSSVEVRRAKRKAFLEPNLKKEDKWIPGRQI